MIWIVLPTFNEKENISQLCPQLLREIPEAHILIVDDNSPDGTGALADQLSTTETRIRVRHRERKAGLGRAYLDGFRTALDLGAEKIVQMDADFSHPPRFVQNLLDGLTKTDFVIGSRYAPGGQIEKWKFHRRLLSSLGNIYARTILTVPVKDLTGGFKAWSKKPLEYLLSQPITSDGYGFQIEMTYRALAGGYSVQEIPITFEERNEGQSKMSKSIIFEALWKTTKLALKGT